RNVARSIPAAAGFQPADHSIVTVTGRLARFAVYDTTRSTGPAAASAGISALICHNPGYPGASPLNVTRPVALPTFTVGSVAVCANGDAEGGAPSATAGDTTPCPLAKIVRNSPRFTRLIRPD